MTTEATKYYDYEGVPAYWKGRNFPVKVTPGGNVTVYDLSAFMQNATPMTKTEFSALKKSLSSTPGH